MRMKKTWFSYLLWLTYAAAAGISLAVCVSLLSADILHNNKYAAAGAIGLCFALALAVWLAGRKLINILSEKLPLDRHTQDMWECFLAMGTFAAFLLYRCRYVLHNTDRLLNVSGYYGMALVKDSGPVPDMVHGASYIYTLLLSAVFTFFGNKVIAGIVLQIIIQAVTMLFLFFAVRNLSGRLAALSAIAGMAFLPAFTEDIYRLEPQGLYLLLFAAGLWLVSLYLTKLIKQGYSCRTGYILFLCPGLGLYIGSISYLDILGFTLLFFAGMGFVIEKQGDGREKEAAGKIIPFLYQFVVIAATALLTAAMLLLLRGLLSEQSFYQTLSAFIGQYTLELTGDVPRAFVNTASVAGLLLFFPAFLLAIGFWMNKEQKADAWIALLIVALLLHRTGFAQMDPGIFVMISWTVLAGLGLCSMREDRKQENKESRMPVENTPEDLLKIKEQVPELVIEELETEPKVKFIENPLPLPKKHVPREMNYNMDIEEAEMEFDINTSENDDFDI